MNICAYIHTHIQIFNFSGFGIVIGINRTLLWIMILFDRKNPDPGHFPL